MNAPIGSRPIAGGPSPYQVDLAAGPTPDGRDLHFGPLTFYRDRSPDGLLPVLFDPEDGGGTAVRLSVQAGSYTGALFDLADVVNDRCELRGPKHPLGSDAWYGFSVRVPADFPIRPLRCVVAQMKMPYDASGDGSPALALRIEDGRWLATVEHLYEPDDQKLGRFLSTPVNGRCASGTPAFDHSNFNKYNGLTDFQVRALLATDADDVSSDQRAREFASFTTGVVVERHAPLPGSPIGAGWTDFVVRALSSGIKNKDGVVELYAEGELVARAHGEFGYPSTEGEAAQYFKVGPYRNNDQLWGSGVASLEYRHLRRGQSLSETLEAVPTVA